MASRLRMGVIGTGRIGNIHTGNLVRRISNADVIALSDPDLPALERTASEFGVAYYVADYTELLKNDTIEAVAISSASPTHPQIIRDSAVAGKHIFCEKPIGFELSEIDDAIAAVEDAGVKFQVGFNRRFDVNFQRARERVVAGDIGIPHVLRITSRDPEAPPADYLAAWGGYLQGNHNP